MIMKSCILSVQNIKTLLILIVFFAFSFIGKAQQFKPNTEVGVLLGASYYLGDLNTTHFDESSVAAGLIIRKNIDRRFSYKAELLYLNIAADDRNSNNLDTNRGLHFRSPIYELSGQIEFNFLPYQPGNSLYTWTPFVYTGVSLFNFNPQAENKNGEWVDLQPLGTEGQGSQSFVERQKYSLIQFAIPIGGGIKIAVNPSFSIILEYGIRKTFTDYLDDVSTTFVGGNGDPYPVEMSQDAINMSDPRAVLDPLLAHSKGYHRGDPNKNDWYSFAGITLSFKLNNNTKDCDY
jgi:hypothetical protein